MGRSQAARPRQVPTIRIDHITEAQKRAYIIADDRLAELAGWDQELLAVEFGELSALDLDFELEITGFETTQTDLLIDGATAGPQADPADELPQATGKQPVSRAGDLWLLGEHHMLCGNALEEARHRRSRATTAPGSCSSILLITCRSRGPVPEDRLDRSIRALQHVMGARDL
jgi:hypothetical protein